MSTDDEFHLGKGKQLGRLGKQHMEVGQTAAETDTGVPREEEGSHEGIPKA